MFFVVFNVIICIFIVIDFWILSKNNYQSFTKIAFALTCLWIFLGLLFSVFVYANFGVDKCYEYLSAYFIEKSLSIDNIFVFLMIFTKFDIHTTDQRRLLFIGIWSAILLRILMIFIIAELLSSFHFLTYIFGLFILFAGIAALCEHKNNNMSTKLLSSINKHLRIYDQKHNGRFFVIDKEKVKITVLLVAMICIEICDIIFALDSIPAVFGVTKDKMIIYTSNIFAILGLRSLYITFVITINKFYYLKYAASAILIFVGGKMVISDYIHLNSLISLSIIALILIFTFIISKVKLRRSQEY